jgi:myo-inositol catabolism protein IolS
MKSNLGNTDLKIHPVAMGTWTLAGGNQWGEVNDDESIATVHAALANEVNLFDTAPAYGVGKAEEVLGNALEGRRDQAIIATKVAEKDLYPDKLMESVENSLKRLKTDYIDLLQIHWPNHSLSCERMLPGFQELISQGKVRYFGVCNYGERDLTSLLEALGQLSEGPALVSNQLPYSLLTRAIEFEITDLCKKDNVSILGYTPFVQGLLGGKYHNLDDVPQGRKKIRLFHHRHG